MELLSECSPSALVSIEMCESLILTLIAKGILTRDDALDLMQSVIDAEQKIAEDERSSVHGKAALIARYIAISIGAARSSSDAETR